MKIKVSRKSKFISPLAFLFYGIVLLVAWFLMVVSVLNDMFDNGICVGPAQSSFGGCHNLQAKYDSSNVLWWLATIAGWFGIILVSMSVAWWAVRLYNKNKTKS